MDKLGYDVISIRTSREGRYGGVTSWDMHYPGVIAAFANRSAHGGKTGQQASLRIFCTVWISPCGFILG
jgi:hypothetical protein